MAKEKLLVPALIFATVITVLFLVIVAFCRIDDLGIDSSEEVVICVLLIILSLTALIYYISTRQKRKKYMTKGVKYHEKVIEYDCRLLSRFYPSLYAETYQEAKLTICPPYPLSYTYIQQHKL